MPQPQKRSSKIVRPLRGGQVTIPAEFRQQLGIGPDTVLEVSVEGDELRIRPLPVGRTVAGSPWLKELYDLFAPVREEAKSHDPNEIHDAIDAAVKAVRSKRA
jgi:AbrB family looped-hinge helix DNA binding protein